MREINMFHVKNNSDGIQCCDNAGAVCSKKSIIDQKAINFLTVNTNRCTYTTAPYEVLL